MEDKAAKFDAMKAALEACGVSMEAMMSQMMKNASQSDTASNATMPIPMNIGMSNMPNNSMGMNNMPNNMRMNSMGNMNGMGNPMGNMGNIMGNMNGMGGMNQMANMSGMNPMMGNMTGMNQMAGMSQMGNMNGMNSWNPMANMSGMNNNMQAGMGMNQMGNMSGMSNMGMNQMNPMANMSGMNAMGNMSNMSPMGNMSNMNPMASGMNQIGKSGKGTMWGGSSSSSSDPTYNKGYQSMSQGIVTGFNHNKSTEGTNSNKASFDSTSFNQGSTAAGKGAKRQASDVSCADVASANKIQRVESTSNDTMGKSYENKGKGKCFDGKSAGKGKKGKGKKEGNAGTPMNAEMMMAMGQAGYQQKGKGKGKKGAAAPMDAEAMLKAHNQTANQLSKETRKGKKKGEGGKEPEPEDMAMNFVMDFANNIEDILSGQCPAKFAKKGFNKKEQKKKDATPNSAKSAAKDVSPASGKSSDKKVEKPGCSPKESTPSSSDPSAAGVADSRESVETRPQTLEDKLTESLEVASMEKKVTENKVAVKAEETIAPKVAETEVQVAAPKVQPDIKTKLQSAKKTSDVSERSTSSSSSTASKKTGIQNPFQKRIEAAAKNAAPVIGIPAAAPAAVEPVPVVSTSPPDSDVELSVDDKSSSESEDIVIPDFLGESRKPSLDVTDEATKTEAVEAGEESPCSNLGNPFNEIANDSSKTKNVAIMEDEDDIFGKDESDDDQLMRVEVASEKEEIVPEVKETVPENTEAFVEKKDLAAEYTEAVVEKSEGTAQKEEASKVQDESSFPDPFAQSPANGPTKSVTAPPKTEEEIAKASTPPVPKASIIAEVPKLSHIQAAKVSTSPVLQTNPAALPEPEKPASPTVSSGPAIVSPVLAPPVALPAKTASVTTTKATVPTAAEASGIFGTLYVPPRTPVSVAAPVQTSAAPRPVQSPAGTSAMPPPTPLSAQRPLTAMQPQATMPDPFASTMPAQQGFGKGFPMDGSKGMKGTPFGEGFQQGMKGDFGKGKGFDFGKGKGKGETQYGRFHCRYCDMDFGDNEPKYKQHCAQRHVQCTDCGDSLPEFAMEAHMLTHIEVEDKEDELAKWFAARRARFPTKKVIEAKKNGTFDDRGLPMSKMEEMLRDKIDPDAKRKKDRPQDDDPNVDLCLQYEHYRMRCLRGRRCPWRHVRKTFFGGDDEDLEECEEIPKDDGDARQDDDSKQENQDQTKGDRKGLGKGEFYKGKGKKGNGKGGKGIDDFIRPRGVCHQMIHKKKCRNGDSCPFDHDKERVLAERSKLHAIAKQDKEWEKIRAEQSKIRPRRDGLFAKLVDAEMEPPTKKARNFSTTNPEKMAPENGGIASSASTTDASNASTLDPTSSNSVEGGKSAFDILSAGKTASEAASKPKLSLIEDVTDVVGLPCQKPNSVKRARDIDLNPKPRPEMSEVSSSTSKKAKTDLKLDSAREILKRLQQGQRLEDANLGDSDLKSFFDHADDEMEEDEEFLVL